MPPVKTFMKRGELTEKGTIKEYLTVQKEGSRGVK
jgi:hypothetical protein